ncbi:MAG: YdcH family protein [Hyphomicrobium sp.]
MMALVAHLAELAEKHRVLNRKIENEVARPGSDDLDIHRLKVEKLKIKDEIARLQDGEVRH